MAATSGTATCGGENYWSDDVVEIVPVGPDAAYVRLELDFFNGHMCWITGIGLADRL